MKKVLRLAMGFSAGGVIPLEGRRKVTDRSRQTPDMKGCLGTRRCRRGAVALAAAATIASTAFAEDPPRYDFHIEAETLGRALDQLVQTTKAQLIYPDDLASMAGVRPVNGEHSVEEALLLLLDGTGLSGRLTKSGVIVISQKKQEAEGSVKTDMRRSTSILAGVAAILSGTGAAEAGAAQTQESGRRGSVSTAQSDNDDEIVVVGTRIKGAGVASTSVTISPEDMRLGGFNSLGEVVRSLPQNFSGGQNPGIVFGAAGGNNNANYTGSSSLNLRGLGADATLTLLNGARLPYDGVIQATDVSVIPAAAIESLEILLGGASAIYGSDAVGGVANIKLKRDYDGAEVSARYGGATQGGYEQQQYTALFGTTWESGGFLITGDYSRNENVRPSDRDFLASYPSQDVTIFPRTRQKGGLFSGRQALGDRLEFTLDAFLTKRHGEDSGLTTVIFDNERDSLIWGVAPALSLKLPADWALRAHGSYGVNDNDFTLRAFTTDGVELPAASPITKYLNKAHAAGVELEGPLAMLPGGQARVSFGGGLREASFEERQVVIGVTTVEGAARSYNAFGEINLPLVDDDERIPFVRSLTVNAAVRYEDHETFGDVTTPKFGAIWGVFSGLELKASWGESFKAPTLRQQFESTQLYLYPSYFFSTLLPADSTVLYGYGGNINLKPERAEVLTAGFAAEPAFMPGFRLEFGWFNINYTDRVVQPLNNISMLFDPSVSEFLTLMPTVEQQNAFFAWHGFNVGEFTINGSGAPYDPANVTASLSNAYSNATVDHASGFDVIAYYSADAFKGRFTVTANANWINAERQLTKTSPAFKASGVLFYPAEFKARVGANWSRDGLTIAGAVNRVSGVENTLVAEDPQGDGMTTFDLVVDYQLESGPFGNLGFNLAVTNLFDEAPPLRTPDQPFFLPYDSTNYSPLGRVINATITKRF